MTSPTPIVPPHDEDSLLGEIVLRNRLATRERLNEALDLQGRARALGATLKLGEILQQMGVVDTNTLDALLKVQERMQQTPHPLEPRRMALTPKEDRTLGELALRNRLISQEQLDFALKVQESVRALGIRRRIGEILVREGLLSEEAVKGLVQVQQTRDRDEGEETRRMRHAVSQQRIGSPDLFFGQVAVHHGFVTEEQVKEAVEVQRLAREMGVALALGEVLHQQNVLTDENITQIAEIQNLKKESYFGMSMGRVIFRKLGDDSIGDLLCERHVLDPWQIEECAKIQKELGKLGITRRLGEIFLDKQYVSPEILYGVLDEQISRRAEVEILRKRNERFRRITYSLSQALALSALSAFGFWVLYMESGRSALSRWQAAWSAHDESASAPADGLDPHRERLPGPLAGPRSIYIHTPGAEIPGAEAEAETAVRDLERRTADLRSRIESRTQRALADAPADEFDVMLVGTAFPDGVLFEVFGQAPLPDEAEVTTSILYYAAPHEGGVKVVRVKNGLFYARTGPLAGMRWTPPGLYTAVAEYRVPADGLPAESRRGMRAASSAFLGTPEAEAELGENVRARHRDLLDRLESWTAALRADLGRDPSTDSGDDPRAPFLARDRELGQIRTDWEDSQRDAPVSRFRETDRRFGVVLPAARRTLQCAGSFALGPAAAAVPPELRMEPASPGEVLIPQEELRRLDALLRETSLLVARESGGDPLVASARVEIGRRLDEARALRREFDALRTKEGVTGEALDAWLADVRRRRRPDLGLEGLLAERGLATDSAALERLFDLLEELGRGSADAGGEFWRQYDNLRRVH